MSDTSATSLPPYLAGLNPAQRQAVLTTDGPVLVLSGAGTGKTRVLTTRIAHLLNLRLAWPSQILAVTFTNKAAREMRERIAALVGPMAQDLWLGTFHALAARLLRRHAELVGLRSNFTILDADDQVRLVKQQLAAAEVDEKRWPARMVLGAFERWKDKGLTPDKLGADAGGEVAGGRLVQLYSEYQERLKTLNACDFGDLMLHMVALFQRHPDVLAEYQQKFRYILVDEYQDTNTVQYLWLRLLAQGHRNLCCVGDDDQSIYGWRGAEIENILRFERDFPGAAVIRLEQNYRSTPHILAAASHLIAHNSDRLGKTLWTDVDSGEKVRVRGVWDGPEEARSIGDIIEDLQREGHHLADMAILVRAGFQTREFEERFLTLGLGYKVVGGLRFYERAEIRDAIAYLRVVRQPDDDLALERIINTPRRGLGDTALANLRRIARGLGTSLMGAMYQAVGTDELKPAARKAVRGVLEDFDRWRRLADGVPPHELLETLLEESGYTDMWKADKSVEAPGRLDNLKELVRAVGDFDTLESFLEHVALVMENAEDTGADQITLMTMHAAKGLEFETVFLPGWEEGVFPSQRSLDENGSRALEEERRLAYVGLTRARRRAYVYHAANRRIHGQWVSSVPSRFLAELPGAHIEEENASGLAGSRAAGGFAADTGFDWNIPAAGSWSARRQPVQPMVLQGSATRVSARPAKGFTVGERVFHQKFGYGTVRRAEGEKLEVAFETSGAKNVLAGFVEKTG
jgi:DNA helicase-2/ATP-dependent DNA helicase PcrA